tara:strand:- start:32471 stop:33367 length:897 start_codon:yes stop_codon:yes gene_type:complete
MKYKKEVKIYSFYRFKKIKNKKKFKFDLDIFLKNKNIRGTILIASEGINGTISGDSKDLKSIINLIKKILNIRVLSLKINVFDHHPFSRIKVRLKNEIVTLGLKDSILKINNGKYVKPKDWDKLINSNEVKCIDTRNKYEISIGKFSNSINPGMKSFREFPEKFQKLEINKNLKIAIYCTGGIRCEKASAYLKSQGYKKVYQLEGGILNYLDEQKLINKKDNWQGECFVFDKRVTVNKNLKQGKYLQCYGCRRPIPHKMVFSENYKKGVHCPYCYLERTKEQKRKSTDRQKQIDKNLI